VHPFLLSHEEKWPCLDLSMKGGHGQTSSSMGNHGGAHRRGRGGGRGGGEGGAVRLGRGGGGGPGCSLVRSYCSMRKKRTAA
jgi:hypothetical protein